MFINRYIFILVFLLSSILNGQSASNFDTLLPAKDYAKMNMQYSLAKSALDNNMPLMANILLKKIVNKDDYSTLDRKTIYIELAKSYICLNQFDEAQKVIEKIENYKENSLTYLLYGLCLLMKSDLSSSKKIVKNLQNIKLDEQEKILLEFIKAINFFISNEFEKSEEILTSLQSKGSEKFSYFEKNILSFLSSVILVLEPQTDKAKIKESLNLLFKELKAEKNLTKRLVLERLICIYLVKVDRQIEAFERIDELLANPLLSPLEKDYIKLLQVRLMGVNSSKSTLLLTEILRDSSDINSLELSSDLLSQTKDKDSYIQVLLSLLENPKNIIEDKLLLMLSRAYLDNNEPKKAQAQALKILDLPNSKYHKNAQEILALIAFTTTEENGSIMYRTAASYLDSLINLEDDISKKTFLLLMQGDCYFLNSDYENASNVYFQALDYDLSKSAVAVSNQAVISALVLSDVRANNLENAKEHLKKMDNLKSINPDILWRAYWTVIDSLNKDNKKQEALECLHKLIDNKSEFLDDTFRLKLAWLEAFLYLDLKNYDEVLKICKWALNYLDKQNLETSSKLNDEIYANLLLIEARVYMDKSERQIASDILKSLFEKYPNFLASEFALLYLVQNYANSGNLEEARNWAIKMSDNYPKSKYADLALFYAALNTEQKGTQLDLKDAIKIFDRIRTSYPDSPLVFSSFLRQGSILRKLNAFKEAQEIYTEVLKRYPKHKEVYLAQLQLADTLLAQGEDKQAQAEVLFELIWASNSENISEDARVEAGYKWGFLLEKMNKNDSKIVALWRVINKYKQDENFNKLKDTGFYWLSRSVLDLARSLESADYSSVRDARSLYDFLIEKNLPGKDIAREKLRQ